MNKVENIKEKHYIKRFTIFAIVQLIGAINYNLFLNSTNLVVGGAGGIAIITKGLFNIEPSIMIFIVSFALMILGICFLSKEDTLAAIFVTISYPLFVELTKNVGTVFNLDLSSLLLVSVVAGVINGLTNGIIYTTGLNTGGIGALSKVINSKKKGSVPRTTFIINSIIVITGGFIFGANMVMYAIIFLYISKVVSERILLGISRNKMFYIISKESALIQKFIMEDLNHDVTIFDTKGKFLGEQQKAIMTVIPTKEYFLVKEGIKDIDKNAFVTITDSYEVKGQDIKINSVNHKKKRFLSRIFPKKML
jgi:uncharacterized membrane-anchored protein YitT (DUF2179 family)